MPKLTRTPPWTLAGNAARLRAQKCAPFFKVAVTEVVEAESLTRFEPDANLDVTQPI